MAYYRQAIKVTRFIGLVLISTALSAISQGTIEYEYMTETTLQAANQALATIYSTDASKFNHRVDLIQSVMSQPQILSFIQEYNLEINSPELLLESLCHTSFSNEFKHLKIRSNERLELLGDAVLDLYVTNKLFEKFPNHEEGSLSRMRGALVNESKLQQVAELIKLSNLILTGKGETKKAGYTGAAIMADALEAVVGSLFRMGGLSMVTNFLDDVFAKWERTHEESFFSESVLHLFDAKSRLQELTMAYFKELPVYEAEETPEGFRVRCLLKGKELAVLEGPSKKKAQRELAQIIIQNNLLNISTNMNEES